jgi:hypothetical protein
VNRLEFHLIFHQFKTGLKFTRIQITCLYNFCESQVELWFERLSQTSLLFLALSQAPSVKVSGDRTGARACSEPKRGSTVQTSKEWRGK